MEDLVSIITPTYNCGKYIKETIESVINQTYKNWEMIIIDDCSTDNTKDIVKQYQQKYSNIIYKMLDESSGAAIARNTALKMAKGKYVAFLDSDDLWLPEKLEHQIKFMKDNNYVFTYTDYRIKLNGKWLPYVYTGPNVVTKHKLYNYCYFSTITVMYEREKIGLIQIADIKKNNDYAMWFQAIEKSPCYRLPECLSYYIKHENSISSGSKYKLIKYHYIMFRKALNKGKLVSLILTTRNLFFGVIKKIVYKKKI